MNDGEYDPLMRVLSIGDNLAIFVSKIIIAHVSILSFKYKPEVMSS